VVQDIKDHEDIKDTRPTPMPIQLHCNLNLATMAPNDGDIAVVIAYMIYFYMQEY
jgi:hypothetical protein